MQFSQSILELNICRLGFDIVQFSGIVNHSYIFKKMEINKRILSRAAIALSLLLFKGESPKMAAPEDTSVASGIADLKEETGNGAMRTLDGTDTTTPEAAGSPEYLGAILNVYSYALGPGHTTKGYYYIDLTDNFKPYGPFPENADDQDFHQHNREHIQQTSKSLNAFVDEKHDQPVSLVFGLENHTFEQKFALSRAEYKDGTLLGKTAESFDWYFANSQLKNLLLATGNDQYFRDLVIYGLVAQESGWNRNIDSVSGAKGLFQAMDGTMDHLVQLGLLPEGMNPYNPEQATAFAVVLFDRHLEYLIRNVTNDNLLFKRENIKTLLIPLLLTSFNAGMGRLVNLAQYLIGLHEDGSIPEEFYIDRTIPTFNDNAIIHLLSRAYTLTGTTKLVEGTAADTQFQENNRGFGKDGAQYFLKIFATARNMQQHGN